MEQPQQEPQTEIAGSAEQARVKTLGIRLDEELHAQLSFIAQLSGSTISDEIRRSLEARVVAAQDDPDLIARAEEVRARLEREAQARQQAIAGFFGKTAVDGAAAPSTAPARKRGSSPKGGTDRA